MLAILGSLLSALGIGGTTAAAGTAAAGTAAAGTAAAAAAPTLGTMIAKAAVPAVTGAIVQKAFNKPQTPRTISPRTSGRGGLSMSALSPQSLGQLQSQYGRRFYG